MTISQAASGRWWWSCTWPHCGHYRSGYPDSRTAYHDAHRHERSHQ